MSCPEYQYPCLYGNREQSHTEDCDHYWLANTGTATVPAGTVYKHCTAEANAIAEELAISRAEAVCDPCCFVAVCISLENGEDYANLVYWTVEGGLVLSGDTSLCITAIQNCPNPGEDITVAFNPTSGSTVTITGDGCVTLLADLTYFIEMEGVASATEPLRFTFGWDCDTETTPVTGDAILGFPSGIALCQEDIEE